MVAIAMADNRIQKQAEGKELVKQIVVRAKDGKIKLVNLIFKPPNKVLFFTGISPKICNAP